MGYIFLITLIIHKTCYLKSASMSFYALSLAPVSCLLDLDLTLHYTLQNQQILVSPRHMTFLVLKPLTWLWNKRRIYFCPESKLLKFLFQSTFYFQFCSLVLVWLVALVTICYFIFSHLTSVEKKNPATERMYEDSCGSIFVMNYK